MDQLQVRTCVQGNGHKIKVQFFLIIIILGPGDFDIQNWWALD
jgi:hypothetical protein